MNTWIRTATGAVLVMIAAMATGCAAPAEEDDGVAGDQAMTQSRTELAKAAKAASVEDLRKNLVDATVSVKTTIEFTSKGIKTLRSAATEGTCELQLDGNLYPTPEARADRVLLAGDAYRVGAASITVRDAKDGIYDYVYAFPLMEKDGKVGDRSSNADFGLLCYTRGTIDSAGAVRLFDGIRELSLDM